MIKELYYSDQNAWSRSIIDGEKKGSKSNYVGCNNYIQYYKLDS